MMRTALIWIGALVLAIATHASAFIIMRFEPAAVTPPKLVEYEVVLPPLGSLDAPAVPEANSEPTPVPEPVPEPEPIPEAVPEPDPVIEPTPEPLIPVETLERREAVVLRAPPPRATQPKRPSTPSSATASPSHIRSSAKPKETFGVASGVPEGQENFAGTLQAWFMKHKRYPHQARARRMQGVVLVWFRIDRDGNLLESRIERGSGHSVLDAATLDLLKRVSPFPAPPLILYETDLTFTVPVAYRLR